MRAATTDAATGSHSTERYGATNGTQPMTLTRRNFAIGCGAFASSAFIWARHGIGDPAAFSTRLPIPTLIDAPKQGNAVNLKVMSGRHAFVHGKPTRTYGYSAPVLGPVIRMRRGDEIEMTVENAFGTGRSHPTHNLTCGAF
jgi:FtsP/CotA-like multicopper oxidase with cupredoxin domain